MVTVSVGARINDIANMTTMNPKIFVVFTILLLCSVAFSLFYNNPKTTIILEDPTQNLTCITKIEEKTVRGTSLTGLIENGQTVKILYGYYNCNEIKRNDIVIYNYTGNKNPLIKIIKALPGDKFSLEKTQAGWNILINNEIAKNSNNQYYVLSESGYKMLSLYEKDYKGIIPQNTYLILGNLADGSLDSTKFGLVDKSDIIGKVEFS